VGVACEGRTIVIGVDSLDLLLVERWAAAGLLPFFASQFRDCSLVRLSTPTCVLQGALWPDLVCGRSPGYHGTYFLTQITNGTYDLDLITAERLNSVPYYGLLDARGVRCAILDFPHVMPIDGFNGLHIVDWLSEFQTSQFTVQPASRKREIEERFGILRPTGGYGSPADSLDGHRELRRKLEAPLEMNSRLAKELLERDDLDHICVVFGEAHKAGHCFWKYMDPTHPDHVGVEPYLRNGVRDVYQLIDRRLSELAQQITPRDNLVIFSGHGMQANYRGDQFVVPILQRLGLCGSEHGSRTNGAPIKTPAAGPPARAALHALFKKIAPESVVRRLRRRFGAASYIDWSRTQVFQLPTDRNSFLRVNLRGREPAGIVAAGKEYDALLTHIESEFRALVNVDTGRPAVEAVFKIHELCPGPRVDELPDLAILWNSDAPIASVESPRLGRFELRVREDRTGNHRPGGFLLARGPHIRRQARDMSGHLLQLPTTLLALHGIPRPDHYEMPALNELLVD
jgi:predicted AlkP superfamily phosphohydrolase/phosphomutase